MSKAKNLNVLSILFLLSATSLVLSADVDKPAANAAFAPGDHVECKWATMWRKATVFKKHDDWTMVQYERTTIYEWVEPYRLRAVGSTTDAPGYCKPRLDKKNTPAPTDPPDAQLPTDKAAGAEATAAQPSTPTNPPVTNGGDAAISTTQGPDGIAIVQPDLSAAVRLDPTKAQMPASADAVVSAAPPHLISLNHGAPAVFTKMTLVVNPQGKFALLAYEPGDDDQSISIQRVELANSDASKVLPLAAHVRPLAISADGKRLITRSEKSGRETRWRVDVWTIDADTPKPLLSFRPFEAATDGADAVEWAAYVDGTHLLTCSASQMVALWLISDTAVKQMYIMQGDNALPAQLSAGGKYLILSYGYQLTLCSALTGNCVLKSSVPLQNMQVGILADLKRAALIGDRRLIIADLESGKVITDVGLPDTIEAKKIDWINNQLVLLDDRWVYDLNHQAIVWEYRLSPRSVAHLVGDHLWFVTQSGTGLGSAAGRSLISSVVLPDPKALAVDQKTTDAPVLVGNGSKVSLEVNINGSADERRTIIDRFTKQLQDNGIAVADAQPIKLLIETKASKTVQQTYSTNGIGGGPTETVSSTQTIASLSFVQDGKPLWEFSTISGGFLPTMVFHKKGESIADAVGKENQPQLTWFLQASIPRTIVQATDAIGSSQLGSAAGRSRLR